MRDDIIINDIKLDKDVLKADCTVSGQFEAIMKETNVGVSTNPTEKPVATYRGTVSKDVVWKFFQDHGLDSPEAAAFVGDLVGKTIIDGTELKVTIPMKEIHSGNHHPGEIYYLGDKDCYALIVGFFHNRNNEEYVATRLSRVNKPTGVDSWMNLDCAPTDDELITIGCSECTIAFGASHIYNMNPEKAAKYLSGKPAYTLAENQFNAVKKFIKLYEANQAGER